MIALIILVIVICLIFCTTCKENFEGISIKPPEWFIKEKYDVKNWFTPYYPDQISKPECMHDRGDHEKLNFLSSAYRFWKM